MLQQYLPFTVLKPALAALHPLDYDVATVLTVYGIETFCEYTFHFLFPFSVATVLTVYGIETSKFVQ